MNATLPPGNGSTRNVTRSNCFASVPDIISTIFHNSAAGRPAAFVAFSTRPGSNTSAAANCGGTYFASTGGCAAAGDRVKISPTRAPKATLVVIRSPGISPQRHEDPHKGPQREKDFI